MKSRFLIFSFVTVCSLITAVDGLCIESTDLWNITGLTSTSDCSFPMISGMALVWQAKGGLTGTTSGPNDWEIFVYDLVNQTVIQITDDDGDDISPQTDGDYVVWQKHAAGQGNQIFIYRIQGGSPAGGSLISLAEDQDNYGPKIAAARVVWTAQTVTDSYQAGRIMLYDAAGQSGPVVISDPGVDCSDPRIDPQQVVWMQHSGDGTEVQYVYNLLSDSPLAQPVPEIFVWNRSAAVDGWQKVLTRHDGTDREIVLYNRMEGYVQITDNTLADSAPVVSQNHITWVADGDIYLADIARHMHVPVPSIAGGSGTEFMAAWDELSGGVDAYYLDVSTDPDFHSFIDGFRALDVGTSTQYRVDGLSQDTTYYYRVSASVNGSTTAQSKSVTVKLTAPRPSSGGNCTTLPFVYKLLLK